MPNATATWQAFNQKYAHSSYEFLVNGKIDVDPARYPEEKLRAVVAAIQAGRIPTPLLTNPDFPYYALACFKQERISYQQVCTLLEMNFIHADFPIIGRDGNLNPKVLNTLNKHPLFKKNKLTDQQLAEFIELVKALPSAEFMYITYEKKREPDKLILQTLTANNSLYNSDANFSFLSAGARDALGLVQFGLNDYVRTALRFGIFPPLDVEAGLLRDEHYAASTFPGIPAYIDIHGHLNVSAMVAFYHDNNHANLCSMIPHAIRPLYHRLRTLLRGKTKQTISKEIWNYIDLEFTYFANHNITENTLTQNLCYSLLTPRKITSPRRADHIYSVKMQKSSFCSFSSDTSPSFRIRALGLILILDWVFNKENWPEIISDQLPHPYQKTFQKLNSLTEHLKGRTTNIQLLKYHLYLECEEKNTLDKFTQISQHIDAHLQEFENAVQIKKLKNYCKKRKENTLIYHYRGKELFQPESKIIDSILKTSKENIKIESPLKPQIIKLLDKKFTAEKPMNDDEIALFLNIAKTGIVNYQKRNGSHLNFFVRVLDGQRGVKRANYILKILNNDNLANITKLACLTALLHNSDGKTLQSDIVKAYTKTTKTPVFVGELVAMMDATLKNVLTNNDQKTNYLLFVAHFNSNINNKQNPKNRVAALDKRITNTR